MSRAVYPGSFNPPTIGHLAIIEAAIAHHRLTRLDMVISHRALAKEMVLRPTLDERVEVIEASVRHLRQVSVVVTDLQLIADIAEGYDVVVMGADKWAQVNDAAFYESETHRRESLERLPRLAIAGRGHHQVPAGARLEIDAAIDHVSSSGARTGEWHWMTEAARDAGHWS